MSLIRLQKIISSSGICSRRKAEYYIKSGCVSINGKTVTTLGTKADSNSDIICFKGCIIKQYVNNTYLALNKPIGYVTTCYQKNVRIVTDLINLPDRLFPIGRLDKNSTGLLLMTNDGRIHHKLSHPSFQHEKEYYVKTKKPISHKSINIMKNGIILDGKKTAPAKIFRLSSNEFNIVLIEGRNRQIRRMIRYLRNKVIVLRRIRVENIKLGNLKEGEWRYLSQNENKVLLRSINIDP